MGVEAEEKPKVWIVTGASRGLLGFGSFWEMRELIASATGLSGATLGRECVTDTKVSISEEKARSVKSPGEQTGISITTWQRKGRSSSQPSLNGLAGPRPLGRYP